MHHPTAASQEFPCQACEVRDKAICSALSDEELRELSGITTEVNLRKRTGCWRENIANHSVVTAKNDQAGIKVAL